MNGRPEPKVLLMQLSERTSARGTRYLSGFLDRAKLVAFLDQAPDKFGNPQWSVYASEPAPRGDQATGAGPDFLYKDTRPRAGEGR